MPKTKDYISAFENCFVTIVLILVTFIPFLQILERKVIHFSLLKIGGQEIVRYSFIYLTYVGVSIAVRSQAHVKMNFVLLNLPRKVRKVVEIVGDLFFLGFCVVMCFQSTCLVGLSLKMGDITPALGIPMYVIYLALPLGFGLSSFHLALIIHDKIRTGGEV